MADLEGKVSKLHLEPGDILVVDSKKFHPEDIESLTSQFSIPVVVVPGGDLRKLSRSEAVQLLKELVGDDG
jgi:hypothetical protein